MNQRNVPPKAWLLALQYVCYMQNHLAYESLGWRTPTEWLLGYTPDISVLIRLEFWEPVFYQMRDASFPSDSTECLGRFVGIAENGGHAMSYKILTDSDKIITRSVVRSARHGNGRENE